MPTNHEQGIKGKEDWEKSKKKTENKNYMYSIEDLAKVKLI